MAERKHNGEPPDDVSSAPESGTVRGPTSGNQPAHPNERGNLPDDTGRHPDGENAVSDDASTAPAER
jgi:hypothetical protein